MAGIGLSTSVAEVAGGKTATVLDRGLGIRTVRDLLLHLPRRYVARGELTQLSRLRLDELVTVQARVESAQVRRNRNRKDILEAVVTDGTGRLRLTFFNQAWRAGELKPGRVGLFAGRVSEFRGQRQLTHPDYQLLPDGPDELEAAMYSGSLIPVYPASQAISSWKIAKCVQMALDALSWSDEPDPMPAFLLAAGDLPTLQRAFELVHRPAAPGEDKAGRARLKWDEALAVQIVLAQRRAAASAWPAIARKAAAGGVLERFDDALPFDLTPGQVAVGEEIARDLAGSHPMHRLLQGEVGSGKTLVAMRAMLTVVDAGGQAVLLAPTEVLANQHYRTILGLLGPLADQGLMGAGPGGVRVTLVTGSQRTRARRQALLEAASGEAGIVVGTHALLEDVVSFAELGLVVVDEQHRFGVEQRAALAAKAPDGSRPHVLVMTATPIPRTVAMTVFGDLDTSVLTELPHGRQGIVTHVVPSLEKPAFAERVWERIREEVAAGGQAYVVCPRVAETGPRHADDAEEPQAPLAEAAAAERQLAAVDAVAPWLRSGPLAGLEVAKLHGGMPADEKDAVMRAFARGPASAGGTDVLVATTVIEVGVDVPNATVMVIMDADRFGVSALHQLRGRVGRGSKPGLCLLMTSAASQSPTGQRLAAVAATTDGFELSELDLRSRREGDVLGAAQSGNQKSLRMLSLLEDADVISRARQAAAELVSEDPELAQHPLLAREVSALLDAESATWLDRS